jgi:hypothetical protein
MYYGWWLVCIRKIMLDIRCSFMINKILEGGKAMKYYKALTPDMKSFYDKKTRWEIGKIVKVKKPNTSGVVCSNGIHLAKSVWDCFVGASFPCRTFIAEPIGKIYAQDEQKIRCKGGRLIKEVKNVNIERVSKEIERIKNIDWFKPTTPSKKAEKLVKLALEIFGLKAKLEYKKLEVSGDWSAAESAARSAAWKAAWKAAWSAARSAARSAAESAARSAAESAARSAAWSAARSAAESAARSAAWSAAESAASSAAESAVFFVSEDLVKRKYPLNPFKLLMDLWEMGFYVVGLTGGKFILYYVPKNP